MPDPAPAQLDAAAASRLRRLNVIVGSVHALQAVVLLVIAAAASLPITASFLVGPPGAGDYGAASLGSVRIGTSSPTTTRAWREWRRRPKSTGGPSRRPSHPFRA